MGRDVEGALVIYQDAGEVESAVEDLVAEVPLTRPAAGLVEAVSHGQGAATWTPSELALTATRPTSRRHLEYSVSIEAATAGPRGGYAWPGAVVTVVADLAIVFWYRLRSGTRRSDARAAAALAHDVVRHLVSHPPEGVTLDPATLYRPGRPAGQEWLPVEIRFRAGFDLTLSPLE